MDNNGENKTPQANNLMVGMYSTLTYQLSCKELPVTGVRFGLARFVLL